MKYKPLTIQFMGTTGLIPEIMDMSGKTEVVLGTSSHTIWETEYQYNGKIYENQTGNLKADVQIVDFASEPYKVQNLVGGKQISYGNIPPDGEFHQYIILLNYGSQEIKMIFQIKCKNELSDDINPLLKYKPLIVQFLGVTGVTPETMELSGKVEIVLGTTSHTIWETEYQYNGKIYENQTGNLKADIQIVDFAFEPFQVQNLMEEKQIPYDNIPLDDKFHEYTIPLNYGSQEIDMIFQIKCTNELSEG